MLIDLRLHISQRSSHLLTRIGILGSRHQSSIYLAILDDQFAEISKLRACRTDRNLLAIQIGDILSGVRIMRMSVEHRINASCRSSQSVGVNTCF